MAQISTRPALNNARIKGFGAYMGVYGWEVVDEKQHIFKGTPIVDPSVRRSLEERTVFFSRNYSQDNEIDKLYPEIHITDVSILGVEFLLVPKEKLLFAYEPPSGVIVKPPIRFEKGGAL